MSPSFENNPDRVGGSFAHLFASPEPVIKARLADSTLLHSSFGFSFFYERRGTNMEMINNGQYDGSEMRFLAVSSRWNHTGMMDRAGLSWCFRARRG